MVGDGGRAIRGGFNKPNGKTICRVVIIKPRSNKGNILANNQGGVIFVFDLRFIINYTSQGWNLEKSGVMLRKHMGVVIIQ